MNQKITGTLKRRNCSRCNWNDISTETAMIWNSRGPSEKGESETSLRRETDLMRREAKDARNEEVRYEFTAVENYE